MPLFRTAFVVLAAAGLARAAELTTLENKKATGEVVAITADGLVFKTASGEDKYELTKLATVEIAKEKSAAGKYVTVSLIDGSEFRCADFKIKGQNAELTLQGNNKVIQFPANRLLYMVRDISDAKLNQDFRGLLSKRGKRDMWILFKQGKGKDSPDYLDAITGTFGAGEANGESIKFEFDTSDAKETAVQMTRVYGMILAPPPSAEVKISQTLCRITDANKNTVVAAAIKITDKKSVEVETATGVKIEYPTINDVARLDFAAGALQFLSNLNPTQVQQSSTEGIPEPYRRDRNLDNDDIKMAGVKYPKGLALHSRTVLTYDLDGQYKIFEAMAGVDDCVEGDSTVTLTIEGDFKPIFKEVVKKGDKPRALNLSIVTVKKLTITVESDFLDLGNQVDLGGAKVRK